jgi:hypothetical protein
MGQKGAPATRYPSPRPVAICMIPIPRGGVGISAGVPTPEPKVFHTPQSTLAGARGSLVATYIGEFASVPQTLLARLVPI